MNFVMWKLNCFWVKQDTARQRQVHQLKFNWNIFYTNKIWLWHASSKQSLTTGASVNESKNNSVKVFLGARRRWDMAAFQRSPQKDDRKFHVIYYFCRQYAECCPKRKNLLLLRDKGRQRKATRRTVAKVRGWSLWFFSLKFSMVPGIFFLYSPLAAVPVERNLTVPVPLGQRKAKKKFRANNKSCNLLNPREVQIVNFSILNSTKGKRPEIIFFLCLSTRTSTRHVSRYRSIPFFCLLWALIFLLSFFFFFFF